MAGPTPPPSFSLLSRPTFPAERPSSPFSLSLTARGPRLSAQSPSSTSSASTESVAAQRAPARDPARSSTHARPVASPEQRASPRKPRFPLPATPRSAHHAPAARPRPPRALLGRVVRTHTLASPPALAPHDPLARRAAHTPAHACAPPNSATRTRAKPARLAPPRDPFRCCKPRPPTGVHPRAP